MPKYLIRANYVGDGVKGLMSEGGSRRVDAARAAVESVGGTLDCMYFAFGDTDVYAICDMPDESSAAAVSLLINSSGSVRLNLVPLIAPEDVDAGRDQVAHLSSTRHLTRGPGGSQDETAHTGSRLALARWGAREVDWTSWNSRLVSSSSSWPTTASTRSADTRSRRRWTPAMSLATPRSSRTCSTRSPTASTGRCTRTPP